MFKIQKGSKDIIKIVHGKSVVQPQFNEAIKKYFLCAKKIKIKPLFINSFSSMSVFEVLLAVLRQNVLLCILQSVYSGSNTLRLGKKLQVILSVEIFIHVYEWWCLRASSPACKLNSDSWVSSTRCMRCCILMNAQRRMTWKRRNCSIKSSF